MMVIISLPDCAAPHKQDDNLQKPEMTMAEKLLQTDAPEETNERAVKNMQIEEYAKYRNLNSAQRQNREILVDNFIRGLGI